MVVRRSIVGPSDVVDFLREVGAGKAPKDLAIELRLSLRAINKATIETLAVHADRDHRGDTTMPVVRPEA